MAGADPFVAEICMFPFNFAPKGWAWCDGQLFPISQNTALFSLLGTTYGGDGKSNFALPDFQGRAPMHPGQGPGLSLHDLGETGGVETVTLLDAEIPHHSHAVNFKSNMGDASNPSSLTDNPVGNYPIETTKSGAELLYSESSDQNMGSFTPEVVIAPSGNDQPHNNMQPYLTVYFAIALQGVFPPRP